MALSAGGACDAGKQHTQRTKGPLITITDVNVGPNKPLPSDGDVQIAVDRYLLPKSVTRQSVAVLDANGQPVDAALTRYDPVARVVTVSPPNGTWLTPGQPYKLVLTLPPGDEVDDRGLRAIDRATLDPNQPREFAFYATDARGEKNEQPLDFCGDIQPIFSGRCTNGTCHASRDENTNPAAGLVLDSFTGITKTAINRIANGSNTAANAAESDPAARVFGVNMAVINPKQPDTSWLMYKIELAREPSTASDELPFVCNETPTVNTLAPRTEEPFRFGVKLNQADDLERSILSDFITGREMPYPPAHALTFEERERIRIWIAQGANMTDCGGCSPAAFSADAGAGDQ